MLVCLFCQLCGAPGAPQRDEGQIMESKGRRAPRAAGPNAAPAEPAEPFISHAVAAGPSEPSREPPEPAQLLAEAAKPAERTLDVLTSASAAPPAPVAKGTTANDPSHFSRDALAALAQSQAALSRWLEALSAEMADLAFSGIDSATRTAARMLSVKTLSDAVAVNAGFTCNSLDRLVGGSAKLSELGLRLATETSQPILS